MDIVIVTHGQQICRVPDINCFIAVSKDMSCEMTRILAESMRTGASESSTLTSG